MSTDAFEVKAVGKWQLRRLLSVSKILYRCGKDMARKQNLHHWDNSYIKDLAVVVLCGMRNDIFLVLSEKRPVATFQVKREGEVLNFQKLATEPSFSGKGIGSFCMKTIEEMARCFDCCAVCCEVYDQSRHAIAFYLKRGYQVCGKTDTLKYTVLQLRKNL